MRVTTRDVTIWCGGGSFRAVTSNAIPADILRAVGLRLRATRLALGKKQDELATEIGAERNAYANWEGGTRRPDVLALIRLFHVHRISLDWVLGGALSGLPPDLQSRVFGAAVDIGAPLAGENAPVVPPRRGRPRKATSRPRGLAESPERVA